MHLHISDPHKTVRANVIMAVEYIDKGTIDNDNCEQQCRRETSAAISRTRCRLSVE